MIVVLIIKYNYIYEYSLITLFIICLIYYTINKYYPALKIDRLS